MTMNTYHSWRWRHVASFGIINNKFGRRKEGGARNGARNVKCPVVLSINELLRTETTKSFTMINTSLICTIKPFGPFWYGCHLTKMALSTF